MLNRRTVLVGATLAPFVLLARRGVAQSPEPKPAADAELRSSQLVYLTPIKSDGEESRCKAEIWFGYHAGARVRPRPMACARQASAGVTTNTAPAW